MPKKYSISKRNTLILKEIHKAIPVQLQDCREILRILVEEMPQEILKEMPQEILKEILNF